MASLSISEAWNESAAFVRREAQLVLPIAFLLIALPGALMQASMPVPVPGQLPEPGWWLALLPVAITLALIGNIAISLLALRAGTSVGESLQRGARRFIYLLAAGLLVGLGLVVVALPLILLAGLGAAATGNPAFGALLALAVLLPVMMLLWIRLFLMTPVAAVEEIGPIAIVRRSWSLTKGHWPKLLGFLLLLVVVVLIVSMAVAAIGGILIVLVAGPPHPGSLAAWLILILSALVQSLLSTIFAVMIARIYAQLSGGDPASVFT